MYYIIVYFSKPNLLVCGKPCSKARTKYGRRCNDYRPVPTKKQLEDPHNIALLFTSRNYVKNSRKTETMECSSRHEHVIDGT